MRGKRSQFLGFYIPAALQTYLFLGNPQAKEREPKKSQMLIIKMMWGKIFFLTSVGKVTKVIMTDREAKADIDPHI